VSEVVQGLNSAGYPAGACLFCFESVARGSCWIGEGTVSVCRWCVLTGELGKLIGDAVEDSGEITRAIEATERHAFRSRLLADEQRERAR